MIVYKGFRFRIYPTEQKVARMGRWESALRWLWNLALEQRLMGLCRTDKVYPTAFDQINELTELRAELPWLADVPRNVCAQLLVELDKAWQRCFKRLARKPRWKRKGKDSVSLTEPHPKTWRIEGANIRFPKLGNLRTVVHRPLEGKPKTCTICRDGDQWFASIVCEINVADPAPRTEPVIAIDVGITHFLADSDGNLTPNPKHLQKALKRLARAQRTVARRKKGSKNRKKAKTRVMRLHRKVRRQREHTLHVESTRLAKSHGIVVVEKLNVAGMIQGNLSRSIADAGWSRFKAMLAYKLAWSGGILIEVPAAYSSQTCAEFGHVDTKSRYRETFCCTACGHIDHADLNAARVLKHRFEAPGNPWCQPVEASPSGSLRSRKVKRELRAARRSPSQSSGL